MICQIQDSIITSLKSLTGEQMQLCRYRYGDNTPNDGFVLCSDTDYFFIETKERDIAERYILYLLVIEHLGSYELSDDIHFDVIAEGVLSEMHIFNRTITEIKLDNKSIPDIVAECAVIINLEGNQNSLIYPKEQLFGSTTIESDTDKILDIISELKLTHSRSI